MVQVLTGDQLRAGRGLLDWTREVLTKQCGVSQETIKNIEHGLFRPQEATTSAIIRAFSLKNVEFTEDEGVRRKRDSIMKFDGKDGFKRFIDDVYETAKTSLEDKDSKLSICVSNVDDSLFVKWLGKDVAATHISRMNELSGAKINVLTKEHDPYFAPETKYIEYRGLTFSGESVPFYVYGDKLAIILFEEDQEPTVFVICSSRVARAYEEQFKMLWKSAKVFK